MKTIIFVAISLLLTFSLNAKEIEHNSEIDLITVPLETYLTGHIKGDKNILGKALHSEGKLSYLRDGEYRKFEFSDYLSRMKLRNVNDGVQRTPFIKSIEVTGNVAIGKLVLDYSSIHFTDYMTLLKINGEWKITNKIAYSLRDPKNNQPESVSFKDVMVPLKRYIKSYKSGDVKHVKSMFHSEAKIMSITKGQYKAITLKNFIDKFSHLTVNKEAAVSHQIQSIDATGTVAIGKIILNYPSSTITNYLSLLKINEEWKIVNIAFDFNLKPS